MRILEWTSTTHEASFILDRDYSPDKLVLYAKYAPTLGDLVVDILDDGVSIMQGGDITVNNMTKYDGEIFYGAYTGTFVVRELVSGTGGAYGEVLEIQPCYLKVIHTTPGTPFVVGETITGVTSVATGVIDAWVAPNEYYTPESRPRTSNARLEQGENLNTDAGDFGKDKPILSEGSVITLVKLEEGGANGITVQLELATVE